MAGDVATAGKAGSGVTQEAAGHGPEDQELPVAGNGVTPAVGAPDGQADPEPPGTHLPESQLAGSQLPESAADPSLPSRSWPSPGCRTPPAESRRATAAHRLRAPRRPGRTTRPPGRCRAICRPRRDSAPDRPRRPRRGQAPAQPVRLVPRRRQPGARAADQDGSHDPSEGRHPADRARLRGGGEVPRGPVAQERRSVHHAPARRGHHPGRAWHEPRHGVRRAAARHHRGHRRTPSTNCGATSATTSRRWSTA